MLRPCGRGDLFWVVACSKGGAGITFSEPGIGGCGQGVRPCAGLFREGGSEGARAVGLGGGGGLCAWGVCVGVTSDFRVCMRACVCVCACVCYRMVWWAVGCGKRILVLLLGVRERVAFVLPYWAPPPTGPGWWRERACRVGDSGVSQGGWDGAARAGPALVHGGLGGGGDERDPAAVGRP